MSKGRPSLPIKIKELSGTLRKDRHNEGVDFDLILIVPKPEVWLNDKAKQYFKQACELLISKKILNVANVQLVAMMAEEYASYEMATRELKTSGMVQVIETKNGSYDQVSPFVSIRNQSLRNYKDIASMFGLDPVSAMKVGGAKKTTEDPFDQMQSKYNQ